MVRMLSVSATVTLAWLSPPSAARAADGRCEAMVLMAKLDHGEVRALRDAADLAVILTRFVKHPCPRVIAVIARLAMGHLARVDQEGGNRGVCIIVALSWDPTDLVPEVRTPGEGADRRFAALVEENRRLGEAMERVYSNSRDWIVRRLPW
jgi:hypothetical protein